MPLSLTNNNISLSGKKLLYSSFLGLSIQCPKWLHIISALKVIARYAKQVQNKCQIQKTTQFSNCTIPFRTVQWLVWLPSNYNCLFYPVDFALCVFVYLWFMKMSVKQSLAWNCRLAEMIYPVQGAPHYRLCLLHAPAQFLVSKDVVCLI